VSELTGNETWTGEPDYGAAQGRRAALEAALKRAENEINRTAEAKRRQVGGDHYMNMGVQVWDVVDTWSREQRIGYYRGGALKYLMRMGSKDESGQEIAKGQHYLEKLLEVLRDAE
jgi:hypothetical protein